MTTTETFRSICTASGSTTLQSARRFTSEEAGQWAPWFAAIGIIGSGSDTSTEINLGLVEIDDLLGRPWTNQFPGCNNQAWIITRDEEIRLVAASAIKQSRIDEIKAQREAEAEVLFLQARATPRIGDPCPLCHSHCYGDCTASAA